MGVQKNATYKVHNGTDFDEINFKTILEQVKFPDGTSLLDFINNGGNIAGTRINGTDLIFPNTRGVQAPAGNITRVGLFANGLSVDLISDGGVKRFEPFHANQYELGTVNFPWKDVWGGAFSKGGSGYTKLTNGFILQWGRAMIAPGTSGSITTGINFPIAFPNALGMVVASGKGSSVDEIRNSKYEGNFGEGTWGFNASVNRVQAHLGFYIDYIAIGY